MLPICKSITYSGCVDNKAQDVIKRPIKAQCSNIILPSEEQPRIHTGRLAASAHCRTEGWWSVCLAFFFFFFFLVENQKASAETATRSQGHSTFYHVLFTAICIRVVRKTPIPEGSRFNGKSISIIHFQPESHTLEALDRILGNQEKQLLPRPRPWVFQLFGARRLTVQRSQPGGGAGRPAKKTDLHPTWINPCSTCRQ